MLQDVIESLQTKIKAASTNATPEELAYLGTAMEKIGGRASLFDIVELSDAKQAEFKALVASLVSDITNAKTGSYGQFVTDVNTKVASVTSAIDKYIADALLANNNTVASIKTNTDKYVNDKYAAFVLESDAKAAAVKSAMDSDTATANDIIAALASASAVANQQALNGSLFRVMFYTSMK